MERSKFEHMGSRLPRVPFGHSIVTPNCRKVQADALVEAVQRLRPAYDDVVAKNPDADVHVLLVVTTPKDEQP